MGMNVLTQYVHNPLICKTCHREFHRHDIDDFYAKYKVCPSCYQHGVDLGIKWLMYDKLKICNQTLG